MKIMKPWNKILAHFGITVTTIVDDHGVENLFSIDPKAIVIPKGAHVFDKEKDPVITSENKKRELTKLKIKIANKIIRKVFQ
ncbi:hypothetical protein [Aquimarina sp. AU58]|uniref:hypothetical protein n=1 Tax=Aquimarina sp. AU58 TaxID=1874112 RepID=UPI000D6E4FEE|nr:hypothetical protein [Aquimarina sp. AU58]